MNRKKKSRKNLLSASWGLKDPPLKIRISIWAFWSIEQNLGCIIWLEKEINLSEKLSFHLICHYIHRYMYPDVCPSAKLYSVRTGTDKSHRPELKPLLQGHPVGMKVVYTLSLIPSPLIGCCDLPKCKRTLRLHVRQVHECVGPTRRATSGICL